MSDNSPGERGRHIGGKRARLLPHESVKCCRWIEKLDRQCLNWALTGQTTCRFHGGLAPDNVSGAMEKVTRNDLAARLKAGPVVEDPFEELAKLASEHLAFKDAAAERLAQVQDWTFTDRNGVEAERALVRVYSTAMKDATDAMTKLGKLGLAGMRLELDRQRALIVAERMKEILAQLRLTDAQRLAAPKIIEQVLRLGGSNG